MEQIENQGFIYKRRRTLGLIFENGRGAIECN